MVELASLFFLSSGLYMGWSLGANDAANVFGTAVSTGMIKFRNAAIICSLFVIAGAVITGSGPSHTLGKLGSVNALAGAFVVAVSAATVVMWMTKSGLPVSTSQAIVGGIVGWNLFAGLPTDKRVLFEIMSTWLICPILAAVIAMGLFFLARKYLSSGRVRLLYLDRYTRFALIAAGAFGSYSLGGNNIANVVGVFAKSSPFPPVDIGPIHITSAQILFFVGAVAISVGVFTYSRRVMMTVGSGIFELSPVAAFIAVIAHSIVLFVFASTSLKGALIAMGLPSFPLVPVSSSQAVVGAVLGIGLAKGGRNVNFKVLGRIGLGWVITPVLSTVMCYVLLFIVQNVFSQTVFIR